ncbi:glycosyltransferase family 2 protein [Blastopirellula marina]|uniref:Glycosyltransferase family 2 protein n=1 Tax=Blastopirellula marina TaxID=124 RepID=A0A2S8F9F7_9BACT|nr:glycosyltransferase family 2 protein [Blastopirellula marina]PQO28770.1 glycosyltransferase family 2 protein [Blastopirellula marina]PTL42043.1 glycosyltransferase family 2 protein [Blastopirellula marina]
MNCDVSILVVSYNTKEETLACLESVYDQTKDVSFELIVLDNASHDGSAEAIEETFPELTLIKSSENLGFAGANNVAAEKATGEYLLLLNPDTVILDHAIDRIVKFARSDDQPRVFGGRTFFEDMTLNADSCHGAPTPWSLLSMGVGFSSVFSRSAFFNPEGLGDWQRDSFREVDCITGCFLLLQRSLWNELGGFDLDYFMYGEDTDLCLRARKHGAKCFVYPEAQLIHHGGRSEKVRADKMIRLFRAKHQLFQKHWKPGFVKFGARMLVFWAFTRYLALSVLGIASSSYRQRAAEWYSVFARRQEYCNLPKTAS